MMAYFPTAISVPAVTKPTGLPVLAFCILGVLFIIAFFFLIRNGRVYDERIRIINLIYNSNMKELDDCRLGYLPFKEFELRSEARYRIFNFITYDKMFYKFWIPVGKFYDETKILGVKDDQ